MTLKDPQKEQLYLTLSRIKVLLNIFERDDNPWQTLRSIHDELNDFNEKYKKENILIEII